MNDVVTTAAPPAGAPTWYSWPYREIGKREISENRGPVVQRYIDLTHSGEIGDPWCMIFVKAALEANGIRGTRSASSQSPRHDSNFAQLPGAALGVIAVFWRGSGPHSGIGHAGVYGGKRNGYVWTLGGNEGDMVQLEMLPRSAPDFGLIGYFWPKSVPIPKIGAIPVATNIPNHITKVT